MFKVARSSVTAALHLRLPCHPEHWDAGLAVRRAVQPTAEATCGTLQAPGTGS